MIKKFIKILNINTIISWILLSLVIFLILTPVFVFFIGSNFYFGILFLSILVSKIFLASLIQKNNYNFLNILSYSTHLFLIFITFFLLLKDAKENKSVTNLLDNKQVKEIKTNISDINTTKKSNNKIEFINIKPYFSQDSLNVKVDEK